MLCAYKGCYIALIVRVYQIDVGSITHSSLNHSPSFLDTALAVDLDCALSFFFPFLHVSRSCCERVWLCYLWDSLCERRQLLKKKSFLGINFVQHINKLERPPPTTIAGIVLVCACACIDDISNWLLCVSALWYVKEALHVYKLLYTLIIDWGHPVHACDGDSVSFTRRKTQYKHHITSDPSVYSPESVL